MIQLQTWNNDSYENEQRTDGWPGTKFPEGPTFPHLWHEGGFPVMEGHEKLAITW